MDNLHFYHMRTTSTGAHYLFFCFWDKKRLCWTAHLIGSPQYVYAQTCDALIAEANVVFDRMEELAKRVKDILEQDIALGMVFSPETLNRRCHALSCIASQLEPTRA